MTNMIYLDEDSRIGRISWDACKDCTHHYTDDCDPEIIIQSGFLYCRAFKSLKETDNRRT